MDLPAQARGRTEANRAPASNLGRSRGRHPWTRFTASRGDRHDNVPGYRLRFQDSCILLCENQGHYYTTTQQWHARKGQTRKRNRRGVGSGRAGPKVYSFKKARHEIPLMRTVSSDSESDSDGEMSEVKNNAKVYPDLVGLFSRFKALANSPAAR